MCWFVFFFFKQKTAYEMRISDWSSDVCSSDLRPQPQFEQPIAACGLKVILPLRRRVTDQLDLPIVQPEPFIRGTALRLDRAIVGQQYALRTAFDDRGCNDAIGDIGERLGREYHRDVILAQRLPPFADARGEQRVVAEDPGFVGGQQRRPARKPPS